MKTPAGVVVIGISCFFLAIGTLASPLHRPMLLGGVLLTGKPAAAWRVALSLARCGIGYGLLKPLRFMWVLYLCAAGAAVLGLTLNLLHDSRLWELFLLSGASSSAISRLVAFAKEAHVLFILTHLLTAMYIARQQGYFRDKQPL